MYSLDIDKYLAIITIGWLQAFDNLVITRTFSKAYGLAALRVGYSLSSGEIADYLNQNHLITRMTQTYSSQ
jgi:histidinol-phosphate aminotransferase